MLENRSFDHLLGYLQHDDRNYPNLARLNVSCPVDPEHPDVNWVPTNDRAKAVLGTALSRSGGPGRRRRTAA